ncbi:MAG: hypothetical protein EOP22_19900 [Hyphomicrobiales bacterium]|nr:MAG: hypothetical protein EOP22_19900 [Hyphomicrobiales bacterium]
MTVELTLLLWSLALYAFYLGAQTLILRRERGLVFAATARDNAPDKSDLELRADRALKNFQETWWVFIILALVAHLSGPGDGFVFWGALVWFAARLAYLPLYLGGTFLYRSLVWNVSLIGLVLMAWGVLF